MSCCNPDNSGHATCAKCGIVCKSVSVRTLYHQVRFPENQRITPDEYYFCSNESCSVAYFTQSGLVIPKQHLRALAVKANTRLCYCFDITTEQYTAALTEQSAEQMKDFVIKKTKSGDCACAIRNPSGRCCLADFKQLKKILARGK